MPRVKTLVKRPEWETELLGKLGEAQARTGKTCKAICAVAGVQYDTFVAHRRNPQMMRMGEYHDFMEACKKLEGG